MLNFQTVGNSKNTPILFLHGFLGSGNDWNQIANSLKNDYCCILPDLPGHGKKSLEIPKSMNSFNFVAEQIVALIDFLEIEKTSLVGYSMGGRIALLAALKFPLRFSTLVLEGANPGLETTEEIESRKSWENKIISLLDQLSFPDFLEAWYKMPIFRTLHNNPIQLQKLITTRLNNDSKQIEIVFEKLSLSKQPNLWEKLDKLGIPTFLISGSLDEKYVKINSRAVQRIPNCTHKIVKNAGHNSHFEKPSEFVDLITCFLKPNKSS
jgi:2-succinyl-6-hydroxy-2,4-cyclohexadiene-1-carboxylate synthase